MNVMIVGGGGREHAIAMKLSESPLVGTLYALPGNAGMQTVAACHPVKATDLDGLVDFALAHGVDFAVIAPDDPLVLGAADRLRAAGVRCFGPSARAAAIEGSKVFAKGLMKRYGIPTAKFEVFSDPAEARRYAKSGPFPIVIKADGLALGKGVVIAQSADEADEAIRRIMEDRAFGQSGAQIVIEEFLTGPEVSVLALTDGEAILPLASSMDHKRALDGDLGPNTGGMGVIAPNPFYTEETAALCMARIFLPTLRAMENENRRFSGCLYFGLMLTEDGPKVIEYNCRFGDPETQAVLALLDADLMALMLAVEDGTLGSVRLPHTDDAACCVILASGGYPGHYGTGDPIDLGNAGRLPGVTVHHAGTRFDGDTLVTGGGRVLGVTARAAKLDEAVRRAYEAAGLIRFSGKFCRRDIGRRALERLHGED